MRKLAAVLVAGLVIPAAALARPIDHAGTLATAAGGSAGPHAKARSLLSNCVSALQSVRFVAVPSGSSGLPKAVRVARSASEHCSLVNPLAALSAAHQSDPALQDAYSAGTHLTLGIGSYVQYLGNVAFGRQNRAELSGAIREVAAGRSAARKALSELG